MGSSSQSWSNWGPNADPRRIVRETQSDEEKTAYEAEVNEFLVSLLIDYNDRKTEQISRHLRTIEDALDNEIEGSVELFFGGSVSKHTYVNGLSDVDMLVALNDTSLADKTPEEVRKYFVQRLKDRLPGTRVKAGKMAVTVIFKSSGHEVQLLPALKTPSGLKIQNPAGKGWSGVIHPEKFAESLTAVNSKCNGKVVPVIKLFKGLNAELPPEVQLSGYHIEALAVKAFQNYEGRKTPKEMLQYLTIYAADRVKKPINDVTGQSFAVDEYLGAAKSRKREICSSSLSRLANKLSRADILISVTQWKDLFGE